MTLLTEQNRLEIIKREIGDKTHEEIAQICKCARETISRQIAAWQKTSDYDDWLEQEWLKEYRLQDHSTRFAALTRLKEKKMTQHIESEQKISLVREEDEIAVVYGKRSAEERERIREAIKLLHES